MNHADVPIDEPLCNRLAEQMVFGPQTPHAKVRHNALMAAKEAFIAGYKAREAEEKK